MPKFLDAPVWYNSAGNQVTGLGYGTSPTQYYMPYCSSTSGPTIGWRRLTLNGSTASSSDVSWYAPTTAGTSGQVLTSNGSGAPSWQNLSSSSSSSLYAHYIYLNFSGATYRIVVHGYLSGSSSSPTYHTTTVVTSSNVSYTDADEENYDGCLGYIVLYSSSSSRCTSLTELYNMANGAGLSGSYRYFTGTGVIIDSPFYLRVSNSGTPLVMWWAFSTAEAASYESNFTCIACRASSGLSISTDNVVQIV